MNGSDGRESVIGRATLARQSFMAVAFLAVLAKADNYVELKVLEDVQTQILEIFKILANATHVGTSPRKKSMT